MNLPEKPKIYVESSVVSYLTARPSQDIVVRARQELTRRWWERRNRYALFVSNTVLEEIGEGDTAAAKKRLEITKEMPLLPLTQAIEFLAEALVDTKAVPKKCEVDAEHIAYAAVHGMDFLITWNQKHIATDQKHKMIEAVIEENGFRPPKLLTPERHIIFEEEMT